MPSDTGRTNVNPHATAILGTYLKVYMTLGVVVFRGGCYAVDTVMDDIHRYPAFKLLASFPATSTTSPSGTF